jgi:hypothetical protein
VRELTSAVLGRVGCPCVAAAPIDLTTVVLRLLYDPPIVTFASSSLCSLPVSPTCDSIFIARQMLSWDTRCVTLHAIQSCTLQHTNPPAVPARTHEFKGAGRGAAAARTAFCTDWRTTVALRPPYVPPTVASDSHHIQPHRCALSAATRGCGGSPRVLGLRTVCRGALFLYGQTVAGHERSLLVADALALRIAAGVRAVQAWLWPCLRQRQTLLSSALRHSKHHLSVLQEAALSSTC